MGEVVVVGSVAVVACVVSFDKSILMLVGFDALLVLGKSSEEETQGSGVGAALSSVPVIAVSK